MTKNELFSFITEVLHLTLLISYFQNSKLHWPQEYEHTSRNPENITLDIIPPEKPLHILIHATSRECEIRQAAIQVRLRSI